MHTIGLWMVFMTIQAVGISTSETPLFSPLLSAREFALGKSSFSDSHFNNGLRNPAAIVDTKGIAFHGSQFLGIEYSGLNYVNQAIDTTFGINYTGSSITSMQRSKLNRIDANKIDEISHIVPYEYHNIGFITAKKIKYINLGFGINYKQLVLDNFTNQSTDAHCGLTINFLDDFTLGFALQNITISTEYFNEFQQKHPIYATSLHFKATKKTALFLAIIENKNEVTTHATFHFGVDHYLIDYLPIRFGLDHNRYTFGTGLFLDPFEIDIGFAQSRSPEVDDQVIVSFSYAIEEKNHLH
jgi:hypothetical protein